MNQLDSLRQMTTVVIDTGDIDAIETHHPIDATTNPSLILKAAELPRYAPLIDATCHTLRHRTGSRESILREAIEGVSVAFGAAILEKVPGLVSTEVDARTSFDTQETLLRARRLVHHYQRKGIARERLLIKIAATWEGIQAARILEQEGIRTNLTLLFSFCQAQAAAEANATLISPFVGRILDWHRQRQPDADFSGDADPGVVSVRRIYQFYKQSGYRTTVMGASFRNVGEIAALAGCDKLTIAPALLTELAGLKGELPRRLSPEETIVPAGFPLEESAFRWQINSDAMTTEKLAEGIRLFTNDLVKLEGLLAKRLFS